MLNADVLLAALQWALVVIGGAFIVLTLTYIAPEGADQYTYSYPDGTVVTAAPLLPPSFADDAFGYLSGIALGLLMVTAGAVVFCLRRIGSYLGVTIEEMRLVRNGEE